MKRFIHRLFLMLPLALGLGARPSHADFYALDGRFACLSAPDAVCYDARPSRATAPPSAHAATPETAALMTVPHRSAASSPSNPSARERLVFDPVMAIAARIKAERPDVGDLAALRHAARAGDPRAIEMLAWCALRGIGTERNPVDAYFFYGEAAAHAVPHARANQAAVYTRSLTPEQRQHVLEVEALPAAARHPMEFPSAPSGQP
jgi:hypothetical protein